MTHTLTAKELTDNLSYRTLNDTGTMIQTYDGMVYRWTGSVWESDGNIRPPALHFGRGPASEARELNAKLALIHARQQAAAESGPVNTSYPEQQRIRNGAVKEQPVTVLDTVSA